MKALVYISLSLLLVPVCSAQFNTLRYGDVSSSPALVSKPEVTKYSPERPSSQSVLRTVALPLLRPMHITSPFGLRIDPINGRKRYHRGIDLRCNQAEVYSMLDGEVLRVGHQRALGRYVVLRHGPLEVTYGHLKSTLVQKGHKVSPGDLVAISGNSGRTTGPHLHLSLRYKGKVVNPLPLLSLIDKSYSIQSKINHHIMKNSNQYLTALEHVQADYRDDYNNWLADNSLSPSEETAMQFLEEVESLIDSSNGDLI